MIEKIEISKGGVTIKIIDFETFELLQKYFLQYFDSFRDL